MVLFQPAIPTTEGLDVLSLLTDSAQIARWSNENLPNDRGDRVSTFLETSRRLIFL